MNNGTNNDNKTLSVVCDVEYGDLQYTSLEDIEKAFKISSQDEENKNIINYDIKING